MNEYDSDDRVKTRFFALRDLFNCEEVWVFGKKLSEDMEFYLRFAKYRGITVRWFPDWDEILEAESDMDDDEDEEEDEDE